MQQDIILKLYKENKGQKSILSDIIDIDWYDGVTTGVGRLEGSELWFIFNLSLFDTKEGLRIFTLIPCSVQWIAELKNFMRSDQYGTLVNYEEVKDKFRQAFERYQGDSYLLKGSDIQAVDYEIVKVLESSVIYCKTVEDAFKQDKNTIDYLKSFFRAQQH